MSQLIISKSKKAAVVALRNWKIAAVLAVFYSLNSLFIGSTKLFAGHGELRIFIFIPALTAVWFGPVIGGLAAGFGNLLLDIIDNVILKGESLDMSNVVGFFANLIGAYVVGLLRDELIVSKDDNILSLKFFKKYFRNLVASVIGMAITTGELIGLGLYGAGFFDSISIAFGLAWSIATANTMVLLIAMIPVQIFVAWFEKHRILQFYSQARQTKVLKSVEFPPTTPIEIYSLKLIGSHGLVKETWGVLKMELTNNSNITTQFRIEVNSDDKVSPTVSYTRELAPGETDEKYFKIYPFDDGVRFMDIYLKPWVKSITQAKEAFGDNPTYHYVYKYRVMAPLSDKFQGLVSFITMIAFIGVIISALQSVFGSISQAKATYFALAGVTALIEMLIIVLYYLKLKKEVSK